LHTIRRKRADKKGSKESVDSFGDKRDSTTGFKSYGMDGTNKSNLHNPNTVDSDKYHPFRTNDSNKAFSSDKLIEIQLKKLEKSIQSNEKENDTNKIDIEGQRILNF
jgi:hypothetical protein